MHVTHCGEEHLITLTSGEASSLVDACALLLVASQTTEGCELQPAMAAVLRTLFEQFSGHAVE